MPALSAEELHERARATLGRRQTSNLSPRKLERWLLTEGYAVKTAGGRLAPTRRGLEVGGAIDEISRDTGRGRR